MGLEVGSSRLWYRVLESWFGTTEARGSVRVRIQHQQQDAHDVLDRFMTRVPSLMCARLDVEIMSGETVQGTCGCPSTDKRNDNVKSFGFVRSVDAAVPHTSWRHSSPKDLWNAVQENVKDVEVPEM